ncbi:MAG: TRAP transporter large permease [Lachnospiraceae bacterium]|nr:TRAP transporter large permease [Lachnospiraceae bacterium]
MSAAILFGTLLALILIGLPVCYCIAYSGIFFLLFTHMKPLILVAQRALNGMDSYTLLAIPLFTLAGYLMDKGGLSKRLVDFLEKSCFWLPGGMGTITILCCAVFAALTGSGPATVAGIGAIMYPALINNNYNKDSAAGLLACGGALGPVIPPSICMIVYGTTMSVSVPAMFMASIVPGLCMALALIITNVFVCKKQGVHEHKTKASGREIWEAFKHAWGVLLLPIVVLGGIYGGVFTPTEAAAISVAMALILGVCYREISIKSLIEALYKTVETSAMVIIIVGLSALLSWILSATGIPAQIAEKVVPILGNKYVYWFVLLLILFIIGCLMETVASMLILAPILVPIGIALGIDKLHLAVVFCIALVVGMVTPPFGLNLFTACGTTGRTFTQVVHGMVPYLISIILVVIIVAFVPGLALGLPTAMGLVW